MSVQRTRTRTRTAPAVVGPPTRAERDRERLADDVAELRVLWAALEGALIRDSGGSSVGGSGSSGVVATTVLSNAVNARIDVAREADELGTEVMRILSLARRPQWPVLLVLDQADSWHRRLTLTDYDNPTGREVCTALGRWRRQARAAIGLSLPARNTDHQCPYHRETDPTLLRIPGDQATLAPAILTGRWPAASEPRVRWELGTAVVCTHCHKKWHGLAALATLRRLLDTAA